MNRTLAYALSELIRDKPSDVLIHNIRLEVYALDRQERFAESAGVHNIQLPFSREAGTILDEGGR